MITTMRLLNTSITSHSYLFFVCVVRTFKIYSLSNLQVYNTLMFTTVSMLYTHLISCFLYVAPLQRPFSDHIHLGLPIWDTSIFYCLLYWVCSWHPQDLVVFIPFCLTQCRSPSLLSTALHPPGFKHSKSGWNIDSLLNVQHVFSDGILLSKLLCCIYFNLGGREGGKMRKGKGRHEALRQKYISE